MSNPVFRKMSETSSALGTIVLDSEPMTVNGAINKSLILFALLAVSSTFTWNLYAQGAFDKVGMLTMVGFVVSILAFIVAMFSQRAIKYAAPIYAVGEGFLIGGISAQFEKMFPGIVIQAVGATFMALFCVLALYRARIIKCDDKFRSTIFVATLSICGIYLIQFIGSFFGLHIPQIFNSGIIGIGFSVIVCIIAALNLIMDFDNIEQGARNMLNKNFEWFCAFGLMVTMVWLYIEILNLLAKINSRN